MKSYLSLLFVLSFLFISSCKRNNSDDCASCPTSQLGITPEYRFLWQDYNPATSPEPNPQWTWTRISDTLRISINIPTGGESGRSEDLYFKLENNCVRFIKKVDFLGEDQVDITVDQNGNVISTNEAIPTVDTLGNFELQEWIQDRRIVGQYTGSNNTGTVKFWVESN